MRIAFILYGEADERSGGFLYDRYLINRLIFKGHRVEIFSQKEGRFFTRLLGNSKRLLSSIRKFNPDLIIEDELNHTSLFIVNKKLKSNNKAPVLTVVHHLRSEETLNIFSKFIVRKIEAWFLNECDAFIINSNNTLQSINRLLKTEIKTYQIVYPGKDHLVLHERSHESDGILRLLFVGNLIPRKNLEMVLRVLKKIQGKKWILNICGSEDYDPAYMKKLHSLSAEFEESKQIIYNGRVSNDVLSSLLAGSQVLLAPSAWEGLGIIYLEAQRAGVVPVASNSGGAVEIIDDGINGFLISAGDSLRLEELLRDMIENPAKIARMSGELSKKSETFKDWEDSMDVALRFIEEICPDRDSEALS